MSQQPQRRGRPERGFFARAVKRLESIGRLGAVVLTALAAVGGLVIVSAGFSASPVQAAGNLSATACAVSGTNCTATLPCPVSTAGACPSTPTVTATPVTNLANGEYVQINTTGFPSSRNGSATSLWVGLCANNEVYANDPNCLNGTWLGSQQAYQPSATPIIDNKANLNQTNASYPVFLNPSGPGATAFPTHDFYNRHGTQRPGFYCGPTQPCSLIVSWQNSILSSAEGVTPANSVAVPLTFTSNANGCPASDPQLYVSNSYSVQQLLPAAVGATCTGTNGVIALNTSEDNDHAVGDFASGQSSITFIDNPQDPGISSALLGKSYAYIPVAVSGTAMAYLGAVQSQSSAAVYPANSFNLTPAMVAGLMTGVFAGPAGSSNLQNIDGADNLLTQNGPVAVNVPNGSGGFNTCEAGTGGAGQPACVSPPPSGCSSLGLGGAVTGNCGGSALYADQACLGVTRLVSLGAGKTAWQACPKNTSSQTRACQKPTTARPCLLSPSQVDWTLPFSAFNLINPQFGLLDPRAAATGPVVYGQFGPNVPSGATWQATSWVCNAPNTPLSVTYDRNAQTSTSAKAVPIPVPVTEKVVDHNTASSILLTSPNVGPKQTWPITSCDPTSTTPVLASGFTGYSPSQNPASEAKNIRAAAYGSGTVAQLSTANQTVAGFGLMDSSEAAFNGLNSGSLQNPSGQFVPPTTASLEAAVTDSNKPTPCATASATCPAGTFQISYNNPDPNAYVMPNITYALVSTAPQPATTANAESSLLTNLVNFDHASAALPPGYAPLPSYLYQAALSDIKTDIVAEPATPGSGSGSSTSTGSGDAGFPASSNGGGFTGNSGASTSSLPLTTSNGKAPTSGNSGNGASSTAPTTTSGTPQSSTVAVSSSRLLLPALALLALASLIGGPLLLILPALKRRRLDVGGQS